MSGDWWKLALGLESERDIERLRRKALGLAGRDGVMPANGRESGLINRHAKEVYSDLLRDALAAGATADEFRAAVSNWFRR